MTPAKTREVLVKYDNYLSDHEPIRDLSNPRRYSRWMCKQAIQMLDVASGESGHRPVPEDEKTEMIDKANRWLGFIQGVLWTTGEYTIDEMREHNREPQALRA